MAIGEKTVLYRDEGGGNGGNSTVKGRRRWQWRMRAHLLSHGMRDSTLYRASMSSGAVANSHTEA